MTIKHAGTLPEVRERSKEPATAAAVMGRVIDGYLATSFGSLSKTEIDYLFFSALLEAGVVGGSHFEIARTLRVPTSRVKALMLQHQLRSGLTDEQLNRDVLAALRTAKFAADGKRLSFGIESPLHRALVEARLKERGVFADVSLGSEVLKVPTAHFGDLLAAFFTPEEGKRLAGVLNKQKLLEGDDFQSALNKFAGEFAKKAGKEALDRGWKEGVDYLIKAARGEGGGEGLPDLLAGFAEG